MESYKKYMLTLFSSESNNIVGGFSTNKNINLLIILLVIYGSINIINFPHVIVTMYNNNIINFIILSIITYYFYFYNKVIGFLLYLMYILTYHYVVNIDMYTSFSYINVYNEFIEKRINNLISNKNKNLDIKK